MPDDRLPTALWIEAALRKLNAEGRAYYIHKKGNYASGLVLLKINGLAGQVRLLNQERDFMKDELVWASALKEEIVSEKDADAYIARAISRDPDLWVVEIEDPEFKNPFEEVPPP